ncbi:hypothetical protein PLESTM_001848000, partial [Pleodorina starrii]
QGARGQQQLAGEDAMCGLVQGARGQQQLAGEDAMCGLVQGARGQQQLAGEDAMCGLVQICSVGIRVRVWAPVAGVLLAGFRVWCPGPGICPVGVRVRIRAPVAVGSVLRERRGPIAVVQWMRVSRMRIEGIMSL